VADNTSLTVFFLTKEVNSELLTWQSSLLTWCFSIPGIGLLYSISMPWTGSKYPEAVSVPLGHATCSRCSISFWRRSYKVSPIVALFNHFLNQISKHPSSFSILFFMRLSNEPRTIKKLSQLQSLFPFFVKVRHI